MPPREILPATGSVLEPFQMSVPSLALPQFPGSDGFPPPAPLLGPVCFLGGYGTTPLGAGDLGQAGAKGFFSCPFALLLSFPNLGMPPIIHAGFGTIQPGIWSWVMGKPLEIPEGQGLTQTLPICHPGWKPKHASIIVPAVRSSLLLLGRERQANRFSPGQADNTGGGKRVQRGKRGCKVKGRLFLAPFSLGAQKADAG